MKSKSKQGHLINVMLEHSNLFITLLYLAIFITLYLIYGSGDTHNNFIYNEF